MLIVKSVHLPVKRKRIRVCTAILELELDARVRSFPVKGLHKSAWDYFRFLLYVFSISTYNVALEGGGYIFGRWARRTVLRSNRIANQPGVF